MSIRRLHIMAVLVLVAGAAFAGGMNVTRGADRMSLPASAIDHYPPTPVSPQPGSKSGATMPELVVRNDEALQYHFRVWSASSHAIVAEAYASEPRWKIRALFNDVLPSGEYAWSCRASYASGIIDEWTNFFLPPWTFSISKSGDADNQKSTSPVAPVPLAPAPGAKSRGGAVVTLVVEPIPSDLVQYHWVVFKAASGTTVVEGMTDAPTWDVPVMMPYVPGIYYWHCRVNYSGAWGPFFDPPWSYELEKPAEGAMTGIEAMPNIAAPVAFPNPCGPRGAELRFNMPRREQATVAVYTVDGKRVRTLNLSDIATGPCRTAWDGKDESGRSVGAGTYLCRITAGDATSVVRVVKSR